LREIWLASIGPVTSATLQQLGFKANIQAMDYTMEGLALAIAKHVLTTHPSE
jgi:uroporphyrinogen-III synthase